MSLIVEQAAKGCRKSMMALYLANRNSVYIFCKLLLTDEEKAGETTAAVFDDAWRQLTAYNAGTELSFHHSLMLLAAKSCQKKLSGSFICKNTANTPSCTKRRKAQGKSYFGSIQEGMDSLQRAFMHMDPIERHVYLSIMFGNLSARELGNIFDQSEEFIRKIYDSSLSSLSCYLPDNPDAGLTYMQIKSLLQKANETQPFPQDIDQICTSHIKSFSKFQSPSLNLLLLFGCIILCGCILFAYLFFSKDNSDLNNREKQITDSESGGTSAGIEQEGAPDTLLADATYYADIVIQDYGTITVALDQNAAPITTANFVSLAQSGFYDGLTFHRIIDGFMMQGGDPNGDGTGGSGTTIAGEFINNGYDNPLSHTRGAVSMARSSDYNSASSQFFIVQQDASESLDGDYAVFGYVIEGIEIVDEICESANPTDGNGTIPKEEQPIITAISIRTE